MALEKIFLIVFICVLCAYALALVFAAIAVFPYGLVGLIVLAGIGYVAYRLIKEHLGNKEDRYYEDNFDR